MAESALASPPAAIESLMMSIPGAQSPIGRVVLFGGAGMAFAYVARPSLSFKPDGSPRPWILLNGDNAEATLMPYWAWFVVPAVLFGVFV